MIFYLFMIALLAFTAWCIVSFVRKSKPISEFDFLRMAANPNHKPLGKNHD